MECVALDRQKYNAVGYTVQCYFHSMYMYYVVAAPRFESVENQPHNVNASVGDNVIIQCVTYANPPAAVHWFKNGDPLDREYS